jgi:PPOX class probable FMN-dependent enzyme
VTESTVSTVAELRGLYGYPAPDALATKIVLQSLDRHHRAFIALSPFMMLATADAAGRPDVSPRGDLPGFVTVVDEHTLLIPDRPGNKKLTSMSNILENRHVALIFFVPGRDESLRVNGTVTITTDPHTLTGLIADGKMPRSALHVQVEHAHFHCGKALIRSRLWAPPHVEENRRALPSLGKMLSDQVAGITAADAEARIDVSYTKRLWDEPPP